MVSPSPNACEPLFMTLGSRKICQYRLEEERQKVHRIMEALPKRTLKKKEVGTTAATDQASRPTTQI